MSELISRIEAQLGQLSALHGIAGSFDETLAAMRTIDRADFVPLCEQPMAGEDRPLPIGFGQTVSQPTVVAVMTHLLAPRYTESILEIGTGSGYQTAVLAALVHRVHTVELTAELAIEARRRLARLGIHNIRFRKGDGWLGWPQAAPFDKIIVTAAAVAMPAALLDQLAPGGRMVIPVGDEAAIQDLLLVEKDEDGSVQQRSVMGVRFVPLRQSRA